MLSRGAIHNRERARQQRDYSTLRVGNITPTDIDGLIEYKGKAYVIIELKLGQTLLQPGQRLALERLTDDLAKAGKPTICIIVSHSVDNPLQDVDVAAAMVTEYRYKNGWRRPTWMYTTKQLVESFLDRINNAQSKGAK